MAEFQEARNAKIYGNQLNWDSNACSKALDKPIYNFKPACQRHDFGYRNYKRQGRFTEGARKRIDEKFRSDMRDKCAKHKFLSGTACRKEAEVYFQAVRRFG